MAEFERVATAHAGTALEGKLLKPTTLAPRPGVLVMSTAMGMGAVPLEAVRRLAQAGYVALATDLYGGGAGFVDDLAASAAAITPLMKDPDLLRARVVHWFDLLRARADVDSDRVAAVGYCFGGQCALELARSGADLKAVVSYHGLLTTHRPAPPGGIRGQVAIYTGRHDPYAPREQVEAFRAEMIAADARFHITEFGNSWHSFTDPEAKRVPVPGVEYDALARDLSWVGTLALLDAVFR